MTVFPPIAAPRVPVDELEHPLLERLVRPQGEDVEELEGRGHHLAVTPQAEHAEKALLQAPETGRVVGEVDLHPGRELRLKVPPVHNIRAREPGKPSEVYGMPPRKSSDGPRASVSVRLPHRQRRRPFPPPRWTAAVC